MTTFRPCSLMRCFPVLEHADSAGSVLVKPSTPALVKSYFKPSYHKCWGGSVVWHLSRSLKTHQGNGDTHLTKGSLLLSWASGGTRDSGGRGTTLTAWNKPDHCWTPWLIVLRSSDRKKLYRVGIRHLRVFWGLQVQRSELKQTNTLPTMHCACTTMQ